MKVAHRGLIALFVYSLLASGGSGAQGAIRQLTLDDAINLSLKMSERMVMRRESVSIAEAAASGARGAYDPLLSLDTGWRRASEPVNSAFSGAPSDAPSPTNEMFESSLSLRRLLPTGGALTVRAIGSRGTSNSTFQLLSPYYGTQVGVEFRQPLLRNRSVDASRLEIRRADADHERSRAELEQEASETVAAVEKAYWQLLAARHAVEVREEAVRLAEEQQAETKVRIEGNVAPVTEEAQPRAEVERRRGDLLAAREEVSRAENMLKLLILSDGDTELWSAEFIPVEEADATPVQVDVAEAMEEALRRRPELEVISAALERRQAETAYARNGTQPGLDLVVSYDRFGLAGAGNPAFELPPWMPASLPFGIGGGLNKSFSRLGGGDFESTRAGIVFSFPLGNHGARRAAEAATHYERQAEADLAHARKLIRTQVLDAAAAVHTALQRIQTARAERAAAQVQLSAEQERFAAGLSTNFLVLTRQNDLARARLAEISAMTDYRSARTEIARATGSLLAQHTINRSGLQP